MTTSLSAKVNLFAAHCRILFCHISGMNKLSLVQFGAQVNRVRLESCWCSDRIQAAILASTASNPQTE